MKVKVYPIPNPQGAVKAFASVDLDGLTINDVKIIDGKNGLFVSMPTRSYEVDGETKYSQIIYISDEELYNSICDAVLAEYDRGGEKKSGKGRWTK